MKLIGKKYKNPLAEEPIYMKDFIYLLSRHTAADYKMVLYNSLAKVSMVRSETIRHLKRKLLSKIIYFFGTFFLVFGILDSTREYLRYVYMIFIILISQI